MYDYRTERSNYKAHILVLWLFVMSGASFALSAFVPPHPVLWQSLGLIFLFPAIQLIARYLVAHYLYRICTYEDGNVDLEVYLYRGGSKMQLVCRVGLEEITATAPLTKENRRAPKGMKRYNYAPDLWPERACVLSISNEDGECEVLICPDVRIEELLQKPFAQQ